MPLLSSFWRFLALLVPVILDVASAWLPQRLNDRRTRPFLIVGAMMSFTAASATAANVGGETRRVQNNVRKLQQIHAPVRPKFAAVISDLEKNQQKPYIVDAFRHPSTQAAIKARGNSAVSWSLHNAMTPQGKPDALAFDLVDNRYFWQTGNDFWLMQASSSQSHDLYTLIRWGLSPAERNRIDALIKSKSWYAKYRRGKDPGHSQVTGITYAQARKGKRPRIAPRSATARNPPRYASPQGTRSTN